MEAQKNRAKADYEIRTLEFKKLSYLRRHISEG